MSLFSISILLLLAANLTVMEKGMTVKVTCCGSELYANDFTRIKTKQVAQNHCCK